MKHHLLSSAAALLVVVAVASGQEYADDYDLPQYVAGPVHDLYYISPFGSGREAGDCDPPCHVNWGQYRNGALWENYCAEKRSCSDHLLYRHRHCLDGCGHDDCAAVAPPSLTCRHAPTCGRSVKAYRSHRRRDRILSFNIFCDLLGWGVCDCQSGTCCDSLACPAPAPTDDLELLIPVPEPAVDRVEPTPQVVVDEPSAAHDHGEQAGAVEEPENGVGEGSVLQQEQKTRESGAGTEPAERVLPGINVPGPAAPHDPAPEVPRNKLPTIKPASLPSARRAVIKVLVTERLSDYIKT